jgi:hypothetical protein
MHLDVCTHPRLGCIADRRPECKCIQSCAPLVSYQLYVAHSFGASAAGIAEVQRDLNASAGSISWSLSLFILMQGAVPVIWSAVSEVMGRKVRLGLRALW